MEPLFVRLCVGLYSPLGLGFLFVVLLYWFCVYLLPSNPPFVLTIHYLWGKKSLKQTKCEFHKCEIWIFPWKRENVTYQKQTSDFRKYDENFKETVLIFFVFKI